VRAGSESTVEKATWFLICVVIVVAGPSDGNEKMKASIRSRCRMAPPDDRFADGVPDAD